eukprot:GHVU01186159.1.p1 GENE.GHVU01186159.1~~GHVU01186159.1.p1  ORF type:complete len:134 (+),score=2.74 GHVU01186159.1:1137-1538(+)
MREEKRKSGSADRCCFPVLMRSVYMYQLTDEEKEDVRQAPGALTVPTIVYARVEWSRLLHTKGVHRTPYGTSRCTYQHPERRQTRPSQSGAKGADGPCHSIAIAFKTTHELLAKFFCGDYRVPNNLLSGVPRC